MIEGEIFCVGEILWDSMPAGLFMGGAPFNVAHDLHCLGASARMISRVGRDILGEEIIRRVERSGMSSDLIQRDEELPTGFVEVNVSESGDPDYNILRPAAWDSLTADDSLIQTVKHAGALVFGTLACRDKRSREAIRQLVAAAPFRVFDLNLRPGAESPDVVAEFLAKADIVKANVYELGRLRSWYGLPDKDPLAAEQLAVQFGCGMICLSNAGNGGGLWNSGHWIRLPGHKVTAVSSVGAGDGFLAGLIAGLQRGATDEEALDNANLLGAFVVTKPEAAPEFTSEELLAFRDRLAG